MAVSWLHCCIKSWGGLCILCTPLLQSWGGQVHHVPPQRRPWSLHVRMTTSVEVHAWKHISNLFESNQIWIVHTIFKLIEHQTEFRLLLNMINIWVIWSIAFCQTSGTIMISVNHPWKFLRFWIVRGKWSWFPYLKKYTYIQTHAEFKQRMIE